jgi:hypothetical protein
MFLKHPAWAWLKKHEKNKLPPIDPAQQAIFNEGHLFEKYAEQLFPNAIHLGFSNYDEYVDLPNKTKKSLDDGAATIFQGRFEAENITCIVDVLSKNENGGFDLYEIKSSSHVKEEHKYDLAFQVVVLEKLGYEIRSVNLIHVNNEYVRNGEINVKELTTIVDITIGVYDILEETKNNIQECLQIVSNDTCPDLSPGFAQFDYMSFRDWVNIYKYLHKDLDKYSIYSLCRLTSNMVADLERENISFIKDIPDHIKLNPNQKLQKIVTKANKPFIDKEQINNFLSKFKYPLYFFDYETLGSVIPAFDGLTPYQQLPFQYSLHILDKPGGELKHTEYLHSDNSYPTISLLSQMKKDMGTEGTILVWYEPFEKGRNDEMGEIFPEYKEFLKGINDRIMDLMTPFFNMQYADKDFFGSASIKKVLPVLVPELSYKTMNIQEGSSAQRIWMETILRNENENEKDKILKDLSDYCTLDTLAMVKIFQRLQEM